MTASRLMVSASGVRGIFGEGLSPETAYLLGLSFGRMLGGGRVAVGTDTRLTRDVLKHAVLAGLCAAGCEGIDLGICPTPAVELAVRDLECSGGVAVTASHNPAEWNALKFFGSGGGLLSPEEAARLFDAWRSGSAAPAAWHEVGRCRQSDRAIPLLVDAALSVAAVESVRKVGFTVAFDPVNGTGALATPLLLEALGCRAVAVNTDVDVPFAHEPEPLGRNLSGLCRLVRESGAAVGFAQDPDADRLALVDETGRYVGEEYTLALCARYALARRKGPLVANLSTSRLADDVAEEAGVPCYRSPIGEANVAKVMREVGAAFGGEGNGGVIDPRVHYVRDSFVGIALVLSYLAESGKRLSELVAELPSYAIVKEKLPLSEGVRESLEDRLRRVFPDARFDLTDGVKATLAGGRGWVHVRASGTEPVLRVIAEAATPEAARELVRRASEALEE